MKRRHNAFTEHYLVPLVLFALNICLAHLIYVFTDGSSSPHLNKVAVTLAFVLMGSALSIKKQIPLVFSILFYAFVAVWI